MTIQNRVYQSQIKGLNEAQGETPFNPKEYFPVLPGGPIHPGDLPSELQPTWWDENDQDFLDHWYSPENQKKKKERWDQWQEMQPGEGELAPPLYGPIDSPSGNPYIPDSLERWWDSLKQGLKGNPFLDFIQSPQNLVQGNEYTEEEIDKMMLEWVNGIDLNEADSTTPFEPPPIPGGGSIPAPGSIALLVIALAMFGMTAAQIAAYLGIPLAMVLLLLKADPDLGPSDEMKPYMPGGGKEDKPMHPGFGGGSRYRISAPSGNQPPQLGI